MLMEVVVALVVVVVAALSFDALSSFFFRRRRRRRRRLRPALLRSRPRRHCLFRRCRFRLIGKHIMHDQLF